MHTRPHFEELKEAYSNLVNIEIELSTAQRTVAKSQKAEQPRLHCKYLGGSAGGSR